MTTELADNLQAKLSALQATLRALQSVAVAFSGGGDSTLLLWVAREILGDNAVAVTGKSASFPQREMDAAKNFCAERGIRHLIVDSEELEIAEFADNPPNRCYLCKKALFGKIAAAAQAHNLAAIVEASNLDDNDDYRPGHLAIAELGIFSPLRAARLAKSEIRELAKAYGLPTWDKPAFACLSSRFPYGEKITETLLRRLDRAEQWLFDRGFRVVRVRVHDHGRVARIELGETEISRVFAENLRAEIDCKFRELGFTYAALDLRGYRAGSMNATLPPENPPLNPAD